MNCIFYEKEFSEKIVWHGVGLWFMKIFFIIDPNILGLLIPKPVTPIKYLGLDLCDPQSSLNIIMWTRCW